MKKINTIFKAVISFENSNYTDIILYLVYNGQEKLKGVIPQIKIKKWEDKHFLTIDIKNIKVLEDLKDSDKLYLKDTIEYVKSHQQLLLDYWFATIKEFEAKQIFFDEKKEHFGCTTLTEKVTNLPVNLLLYCSYTIDRDNIIFMQNDYGWLNYHNMLIMSVEEDNPQILVNRKINIKESDIRLVKNFIKNNYKILTAYNHNKLNDAELFKLIKKE